MRARTITDEMAPAAAKELAACAEERGIDEEHILCTMNEWEVVPRIAAAAGLMAQQQGSAQVNRTREQLLAEAEARIRTVREGVCLFMKGGVILPPERP